VLGKKGGTDRAPGRWHGALGAAGARVELHLPQPDTQLPNEVQLRVLGAADAGKVALAHGVVLAQGDVNGARPLEAVYAVPGEVVEPEVTGLQPCDLADPHASDGRERSEDAVTIDCDAGRTPAQEPPHHGLVDGELELYRAAGDGAYRAHPSRELAAAIDGLRQ